MPALYLGLTEDHVLSASAFDKAGIAARWPRTKATDTIIARGVESLLNDASRRRQMRTAGLMTIDGRGAARIAADLAKALSETRGQPRAAIRESV